MVSLSPAEYQLLILASLLTLTAATYRRYLSPLSAVPGPFWASITRLWQCCHIYLGDHNIRLIRLHEKYGHFVRIAPNEVSVSHPDGPKLLLYTPLRKVRDLKSPVVEDLVIDRYLEQLVYGLRCSRLQLCNSSIDAGPERESTPLQTV